MMIAWLVSVTRAFADSVATEITQLKPLYPATYYVRDGAPAAVILWGDEDGLRTLDGQLAAKLGERAGTSIESRPANEIAPRWWEIDFDRLVDRNVIALDNTNINRLLAALWGEGNTAEDAKFPGTGGYVVRSVHDPFGRGFNVIVLAGSVLPGVRQAAGR